jgi:signal transduction histidine kinase
MGYAAADVTPRSEEPAVPQRRRWMLWAALAYLGVLAATAVGLGGLYQAARTHLDEALGLRLQAIADATVHLVDGDALVDWSFDPKPDTDLLWLATRLERIREDNELAEVTLCDRNGYVVISASRRLERGEANVFWDLDRPAVELAREGVPSVSRLYRSGALYQKSAHVPVLGRDGTITGVLTVEGSADFFQALAALRRGAWVTVAAVLAFLAIMGTLLLGIHRSLERTRASLARQEHLATMGRMTAGIAHEIRNPLSIIRGAAEHLVRVLRDHDLDDEVAAYIPEEVDRLDRILGAYLAFGREKDAVRTDVLLDQLVRRTVKLVASEFAERDLAIQVDAAEGVRVEADGPRLQQVMLNLLLNARDAAPAGSRIDVTVTNTGDRARVTVADCGPGLTADQFQHVFEPFWTTKDKGSGIGLAVSRRIARAHGGDLALANREPGPGCIATLSLPRPAASEE